jgi:hypothetical protein
MSTGTIEAPTIGIGRLLREGSRYVVPHHQRDYSWSEDEIDQFISDVEEALLTGQPEYFLGLMVFMPVGDRIFRILDGQQRLATTTLLFSAARRWLRDRGYDDDAAKIQSDYIAERELGGRNQTARIVLNEINNPVFEESVIGEKASEELTRELEPLNRYHPNRRLYEAILYCRDRINTLTTGNASDTKAAADKLFKFVRYVEDNVRVVRLVVANEANAYTVFETLNDRGLDLTVLDLVKNHLFGKTGADQRLRDTQARWIQMMANLVNVRADDFLKAWWTSRHGRVQTAQLFPKFKARVNTWQDVKDISSDLLNASEQYAAIETADDPVWSEIDGRARSSIQALKLLGGKQVHPVILSALDRFPGHELNRILRLLEVLIVRYQLIGGGRTGRLEISCASLAKQVYAQEIKTAGEVRQALRDILPSDEDFREAFRTKQESNTRKVAYILRHLELQARRAAERKEGGIETEPNQNLTVEHVLPRRPSNEWQVVIENDPEIIDECVNRIGNLCLLTSVNRRLGNQGFGTKRKVYSASSLLTTRELGGCDEWNRTTIDQRQARLAKLAVSVWRFE